jgi:hypothetical protein
VGRRIIFLDFDGVLNTVGYVLALGAAQVGEQWLDTRRVRLVAEIARRAGARVVLSTSWRKVFHRPELEAMLRRRGYDGEFAGVTPLLRRARGEEIRAYVDTHWHQIDAWVALDDAVDGMDWLGERHVVTTIEDGLTAEHVEQAVRILEG